MISWMGFFNEGLKQLPEIVKNGKYNTEIAILKYEKLHYHLFFLPSVYFEQF